MTIANNTNNNQQLIDELRRFDTFQQLRDSKLYSRYQAALGPLLDQPQVYRYQEPRPRLTSFLRVVEWNIERGKRLEGIIEALNNHPVLRFADLLLLNELDDGMIRSKNVNVALELSRQVEASAVFGAEYLELTKGAGDEIKTAGENTRSLHGNAILSRHPFSNPMLTKLPRCQNNFESQEKRIGGRIGILLDLEIGGRRIVVGNTHLDVMNTPRCRGRQMRAMLEAVESRRSTSEIGAAIVGGDLNTHTFARGGRVRAIMNTAVIIAGRPKNLTYRLGHPEVKEPAIGEFARFGYETAHFNDYSATSRTIVSNLDDTARLPGAMRWWVKRRIPPQGLVLSFRLDWMAARGLRPLKAGELIDRQSGVSSVSAQTIQNLSHNGKPLSDHDPIVVDVRILEEL